MDCWNRGIKPLLQSFFNTAAVLAPRIANSAYSALRAAAVD
jgi:hypothetical protein